MILEPQCAYFISRTGILGWRIFHIIWVTQFCQQRGQGFVKPTARPEPNALTQRRNVLQKNTLALSVVIERDSIKDERQPQALTIQWVVTVGVWFAYLIKGVDVVHEEIFTDATHPSL